MVFQLFFSMPCKIEVTDDDSFEVLKKINNAEWPLIRFWRWPDAYRSAFAITGDIDAITVWDFFSRIRH